MTPLAKLPLRKLQLGGTQIEDLTPLRDCALQLLSVWNTRVSDLSPLRGMRTLEQLDVQRTRVSDLSPLRGLPLKYLSCEDAPIADYTILGEFPLEELRLSYQPERHRDLLRGIATLKTVNYQPAAEVLR